MPPLRHNNTICSFIIYGLRATQTGLKPRVKIAKSGLIVWLVFRFYMKNFYTPSYIFDAIPYGQSHRETDGNGRLLVKKTLLTKGCVSPYYGQEIPNYQQLGLEPNKKYNVFRPIEELQKAIKNFDGIPLLNKHIMDYADSPNRDNWAGCVSNPVIEGNGVYGDLAVWDKEDIDGIEDGSKKELSVGYRSTFLKEPGKFDGVPYDLKMVDIIPNHLALVEKGRVKGAYVFDEEKGAKSMFKKLASIFKKLGVQDSDIKELEDEFKESDHPRGNDGKFTSGGGSTGGAKKEETNEGWKKNVDKAGNVTHTKEISYKGTEIHMRKDGETITFFVGGVHPSNKHEAMNEEAAKFFAKGLIEKKEGNKKLSDYFFERSFQENLKKSNGGQGDADPEKEIKMDKREAIRQILAIAAKPADQFQGGEEERERTIAGILEKVAYNPSEAGKADDEDPALKADEDNNPEKVDVQKIKDEAKEEAKKELAEIAKAKEEVEDVAGKCGVQDSAEAYYKLGLQSMGIKTEGIMDSELKAMFQGAKAVRMAQKPSAVVLDEDFSNKQSKKITDTLAKLPARKY